MTRAHVRVAIIGQGIAAGHHVAAVKHAEGCSVAAVYRPPRATDSASIDDDTDLAATLSDDSVDVVVLATGRPSTHADLAEWALSRGKAVVLERPAALTTSDFDRIEKAGEESGLPVFVMQHHRYHVPLPAREDLWPGDTVGLVDVARIRAEAYSGTGVMDSEDRILAGSLASVAIHYVDLACQLLGQPVAVSGQVGVDPESGIQSRIALSVDFRSGAMLAITSTMHSSAQTNRLLLHSSRGVWDLVDGVLNAETARMEATPQQLRSRVYEDLVREFAAPTGDAVPSLARSRSVVWLIEQATRLEGRSGLVAEEKL